MPINKANFIEIFLDKYFMSMPPWIRVVVYLIIVLVFVHNILKPTVLQGVLWIPNQKGENVGGENYKLMHGSSAFRVNADGRWVLTAGTKIPGDICVMVVDEKNMHVGDLDLSLPLAVLSAV